MNPFPELMFALSCILAVIGGTAWISRSVASLESKVASMQDVLHDAVIAMREMPVMKNRLDTVEKKLRLVRK